MKRFMATAVSLGIGLVVGTALGQDTAKKKAEVAPGAELKGLKEKASYSLGLDMGRRLRAQSVEIDPDLMARGLRDGLGGGDSALTDAEIQEVMQSFRQELAAKQQAVAKSAGDKNKGEGDKFLAENKKKEGVKTTASGLQYKVIKEGTGKSPTATDTVKVHYRGTLIDGKTEFDSSYKRGEPIEFPVNGVIKGWTEALQLMKVGSKWQLFIPSELAYGEAGTPGGPIGPNSALLFDVELLGVK